MLEVTQECKTANSASPQPALTRIEQVANNPLTSGPAHFSFPSSHQKNLDLKPNSRLVISIVYGTSYLSFLFYCAIVIWVIASISLPLLYWEWAHTLFMGLWVTVPLSLLLIVYLIRRKAKIYLSANKVKTRLVIHSDRWVLAREQEAFGRQVTLAGDVISWSFITIIPVQELLSKNRRRLVIWRDSMEKDDWRRMKVWINHTFIVVVG